MAHFSTTAGGRRPPWRILGVLFLGVLMAALDIAMVGPALPAIRTHFGLTDRAVAWVFNTFVLFNLVGVPLMAKLSDRYGRRYTYAADVVLFAAGSLLVALTPTFAVLLVGRGLQGLGASGIFPVASAVVGDIFPPERRGRALGIIGAVFGLAFIIGPIIGGILLLFGWRWLFVFNLPVAALVLILGLLVLPNTRAASTQPLDWAGMVTLGLLLVTLAFGINQIDADAFGRSLTAPAVWGNLLVAALLVPVFVRVEHRAADPLLRLRLFSSRQVQLASLFALGAGLTEAAFVFFPALAVAAFGVTESTASFMLLPLVFAVALGSPVAGRLLDRVGSRAIILSGTLLLTLGLAVMSLLATTRLFFYLGSVLIGLGLSCLLGSSLSYILLNEARRAERTVAQGVVTLFISIGQLTGGALIGAVAASGASAAGGYLRAFGLIGGVMLVFTLLATRLKGRTAELAVAWEQEEAASEPSP